MARLALLGGEAAVRALDLLERGEARFQPQDPAQVTHAKKLSKDDGRIDWTKSAVELTRFVRAMNPWPLARTTLPDGRELALLTVRIAELGPPANVPPGALLDPKRFLVATGRGALQLASVQPAGKPAMEGDAFLRGARLCASAQLH
mgnify:CR=1 FL=1